MKRIFLILCLILPTYAFAQDAKLQNTPADKPVTAPEKSKPVILDKVKLLELNALRLTLENAQLKAEAAIPAELRAGIKTAQDEIAKFWGAVGVNPAELATKWEANPGVDGAIILTRKAEETPKPDTKGAAKPAKP